MVADTFDAEEGGGPTFAEMFAGAGLFSYSFIQEGFRPVVAVEMCSVAAKTYELNLGGHIVCGDVTKLSPANKVDCLIAGPPCQGFSTLGKRNPNDPRNRLCYEVVRWARAADPSVIVVENVSAFLESVHFACMTESLRRLGYTITSCVLNAADFGVPQLRNRSFTFASRIGEPVIRKTRIRGYATVREAFAGLSSRGGTAGMHRRRPMSELALARVRAIPPEGDKRDIIRTAPHLAIDSWRRTESEATDVWGRMAWDRPANTLRTTFINPSKGRYLHPTANRVITFQEAMRLHTIPDDWRFVGNDTAIARQIGNSVPPLLGRTVGRAVKALFESRADIKHEFAGVHACLQ